MGNWKKKGLFAVAALLLTGLCACGKAKEPGVNLVSDDTGEEKTVNLYAAMGKSSADADNASMTAQEMIAVMSAPSGEEEEDGEGGES